MDLIKKIKQNVMPVLGIGVAIGLSAWSLTSAGVESEKEQPTAYVYRLDSLGNIGTSADPNPPECSENSGTYCSVELSAPKPASMTTISQAEASPTHVRTNFRN